MDLGAAGRSSKSGWPFGGSVRLRGLASSSEPAVVAGNSMGGIVATQGAAHCPGRVRALVYVTAFLPKDGQSLLDLTKLPEGAGDQVQANITIEGARPVATMPATASRQALYGSCTDDVAAWAIARQRPAGRAVRDAGIHSARNPSTASTDITCYVLAIELFRRRCSGE